LTFAESALYLASRNNNNWTTEWTTNKRHISAGKSVGIKRLQKKARRSSHPDHFFLQKKWSTKPSGFTSCGDSRSSLKKRSFFFTSSPVLNSALKWTTHWTTTKENVFHGSMPEGTLPFLKKSCLSEKSLQVIRTADIFISTIHIGTASAICLKKFRKTGIIYCRR